MMTTATRTHDTTSATAWQALALARKALEDGYVGSRHGVQNGEISYSVERDGIWRHRRGPDGTNLGDRRIP